MGSKWAIEAWNQTEPMICFWVLTNWTLHLQVLPILWAKFVGISNYFGQTTIQTQKKTSMKKKSVVIWVWRTMKMVHSWYVSCTHACINLSYIFQTKHSFFWPIGCSRCKHWLCFKCHFPNSHPPNG